MGDEENGASDRQDDPLFETVRRLTAYTLSLEDPHAGSPYESELDLSRDLEHLASRAREVAEVCELDDSEIEFVLQHAREAAEGRPAHDLPREAATAALRIGVPVLVATGIGAPVIAVMFQQELGRAVVQAGITATLSGVSTEIVRLLTGRSPREAGPEFEAVQEELERLSSRVAEVEERGSRSSVADAIDRLAEVLREWGGAAEQERGTGGWDRRGREIDEPERG